MAAATTVTAATGIAKGALILPCVHAEEHLALKKEALASVLQRWWLGEVSSELFKLSLQGSGRSSGTLKFAFSPVCAQ